jgi:hypothetical protein
MKLLRKQKYFPSGGRITTMNIAYDATKKLIFCSNGDGTMTIIRQYSPINMLLYKRWLLDKGKNTGAK